MGWFSDMATLRAIHGAEKSVREANAAERRARAVELAQTINASSQENASPQELEDPLQKWPKGDVELWLIDYYYDPEPQALVRIVKDGTFTDSKAYAVKDQVFEFDGINYAIDSAVSPRVKQTK